jgi:hypothetical protein
MIALREPVVDGYAAKRIPATRNPPYHLLAGEDWCFLFDFFDCATETSAQLGWNRERDKEI